MITYEKAGVSIQRGNELVQKIKKIVSGSSISRSAIGSFSGLYPLKWGRRKIFLSGCCDGVGTKLKIAFLLDKHDTVGIDLVAMNVNDLICTGAKPLFFLDYFACGKLNPKIAEAVIRGIQKGCAQAGCVLLGGETAEMPGFYKEGEYDLAGFAIGIVEQTLPLKPDGQNRKISQGDLVLGLPSSGLHSNGFSLVRKIFSKRELRQMGNELLIPTRIYVKEVLPLLRTQDSQLTTAVKGIAHITGGGWIDNIPRILPKGLAVEIQKGSWEIPEIFLKIQKKGKISEQEMFRTFNMGIGMVLIVDSPKFHPIEKKLKGAKILGKVTKGSRAVIFRS